jgi:opacity protein-like surface antigen
MTQPLRTLVAVAAVVFAAAAASAQATSYRTRLAPAPIANQAGMATVKGIGNATATLKGTSLTIAGTFEGLATAATQAKVHVGLKTGVRGPAAFDLQVTPGTSGTVSGTVQLNKEQLQDLAQGKLYVQINSEKAPEGNLWGWLLPEKK